jgi:hypothetical protein
MTELPPTLESLDAARDRDHLRLLAIFHWVFAGLQAVCGVGMCGYGWFFKFLMPEMMKEVARQAPPGQPPPPTAVFETFGTFYLVVCAFAAAFSLTQAVACVLAGRNLRALRGRTTCIVASVLACLSMPLGTILGAFSLVVLFRPSVERLFAESEGRRG